MLEDGRRVHLKSLRKFSAAGDRNAQGPANFAGPFATVRYYLDFFAAAVTALVAAATLV